MVDYGWFYHQFMAIIIANSADDSVHFVFFPYFGRSRRNPHRFHAFGTEKCRRLKNEERELFCVDFIGIHWVCRRA
jgi:hypothetical protein